ncbi:MAG: hypothetical protein ACK5SX_16605 [Sandaracinobacter sp.]
MSRYDQIMDFSAFGVSIWAQFVTVWNAPAPFLAAVVAAWFLIRWHFQASYEKQLSNASSTEKLLERQLQEYKDKTGGDTPDAVKTRIDALEQRIAEMVPVLAAMEPRKISGEQQRLMALPLDPFKGQSIIIVTDAASADAAQMSKGLVAAFNSAGWITQTGMVIGIGSPPLTGVGLRVSDPNNLTPAQISVTSALRAAGIDYDLQVDAAQGARPGMPGQIQPTVPVAEIILTTPHQP